jgi:hypothetical protein
MTQNLLIQKHYVLIYSLNNIHIGAKLNRDQNLDTIHQNNVYIDPKKGKHTVHMG